MRASFVCPRCGAKSFNTHDIVYRYCGRCHAFVDDPLPSPGVQKAMKRFWAALAKRREAERSAQ
jgi:hypothetical protein